jgi:hypothetical protein
LRKILMALTVTAAVLVNVGARPAAADPDEASCSLTGNVAVAPGLTATGTIQTSSFTSVSVACNGVGDDVGTWTISASATSAGPEDCAAGAGDGGISSGTSPSDGNVVGGSFSYTRWGMVVYISGAVDTANGESHTFVGNGAIVPSGGQSCVNAPVTSATIAAQVELADGGTLDADGAACLPTGMSGNASWNPPLTLIGGNENFTISVTMSCTGVGDDRGKYTVTLTGAGMFGCVSGTTGTSSATVSGSGPEGTLSGLAGVFRTGDTDVIAGGFTSGGEGHRLIMNLTETATCPYATSSAIGHAVVMDM